MKPGTAKVRKPSLTVMRKVQSLRSHKGEIAVIDPETGKYFLGKTLNEALRKAENKFPDHVFYAMRIGSKFIYEHKGIAAAK